jgi:hypothetical protein
MRIVKSVQTKVCIDGSLMKEFILDEPLSESFFTFLENFGTLTRRDHLRKPYFSFEKPEFISIKGFVGDSSVEVRYTKNFQDLTADFFHLLLFYSKKEKEGIKQLRGIEESIAEKMKVRNTQSSS